ncbi:Trehalose-6-phosphate phosphatase [Thalassocella blandensis]|nr:Trehalose-6-phosphate phosphatase [Thalassocella blandensis]
MTNVVAEDASLTSEKSSKKFILNVKRLNVTNLTTENVAVFLDFDGTLVDFAPSPDAVVVSQALVNDLAQLQQKLDGAIAIVTGREYSILSTLLNVDNMICACEHGSDIVFPSVFDKASQTDGSLPPKTPPSQQVETALQANASELSQEHQTTIRETVNRFANDLALRSEAKRTSVTLHYRDKPELEATILAFSETLREQFPDMDLLKGKCVVEFRFTHKNKGTAIAALMAAPPFANRTPVFIGDDVTDEFGFAEVNKHKGISIKVGEGETCADHILASVEDVHQFLNALVQTGDVRL